MVDITRQVETEFTLADRVTAPLRKMHAAAGRVTQMFDKASLTVGKFGGVAAAALGGITLGSTIINAQKYLQTVRDVSAATGLHASNVDSVLEVMDRANISAQEGSQIIQKMMISMQRYKMEVNRTGKAQSDASRIIQKLGINLRAGVVPAMVRMAALAKQGKLSMADLNIAFQVSETSAIKLQALLKRGPAEVSRIMLELQKSGLAISAKNIEAFNQYESAVIRIKSAWTRIALVVGARVMPVITDLLEKVRDRIEGWTKNADKWGEKVAGWLDKHLSKVIMIGKIMAANAVLQATLGVGIGQVAAGGARMAGGAISSIMGRGGRGGGAAAAVAGAATGGLDTGAITAAMTKCCGPMGRMAQSAERFMEPGTMSSSVQSGMSRWRPPASTTAAVTGRAPTSAIGKLMGRIRGVFGRIGNTFTRVAPTLTRFGRFLVGAGPAVGRMLLMLAKFSAIGLIITAIIGSVMFVYHAIQQNMAGLRDTITGWIDQIHGRVQVVWEVMKEIFGAITQVFKTAFGPGSAAGTFFAKTLVGVINVLGTAIDGMMTVLQVMLIMIRKLIKSPMDTLSDFAGALADSVYEAQQRTARKVAKLEEQRLLDDIKLVSLRKPPKERNQAPVLNMPNARFDIKQMFAEGFDPDRIAVAFTNDLAALGEKKIQSGLSPIFAAT